MSRDQDILSRNNVAHLFVLIGSNPLPDFVSVALLTRTGSEVHLVGSRETVPDSFFRNARQPSVADQLKQLLVNKGVCQEEDIYSVPTLKDPSNAQDISTTITKYLNALNIEPKATIGLNYTGGTKPMSVHAHEMINSWCRSRQQKQNRYSYKYSYLGPRRISLRFSNSVEYQIQPQDCLLTLEELVSLPGWQCKTYIKSRSNEKDKREGGPVLLRKPILFVRSGGSLAEFEFDTAVMRGYQLFAFSCTTSISRGRCKVKLFEAYQRARQMGGDEAKVALVGGFDYAGSLLDEVNEQWLAPRQMIKVFGSKEWLKRKEFIDLLDKWFDN